MSTTSLSRMVLLAIAASALALVFAAQQYGNRAEDTQAATAAPPGSAPVSAERDQGPAGLGTSAVATKGRTKGK